MIGTGGAYGKLYGGPVVRDLLAVYTTVVRAVPELVLILLLYYAGTDLINQALTAMGYQRVDISGLAAGIAVLGFVQGAYSTEVIRGAILAIPQGQIEAARAYGMSPGLLLRRITLPAMLPFAIPGLANLWLIATKDTALLAVVGFYELALATRQAAGVTKAYFTFYLRRRRALSAAVAVFQSHHRPRRGLVAARHAFAQGGALMAGEAAIINVAARTSLWLQPHRIVLILIALGLVLAAAFFMRWDWLPQYYEMGLLGIWRSLWILAVTCVLGFLLAVPLGLAQAAGSFWFAAPAKVFCTVIRGTPLLIQLWLLYYGLGSLFPQYPWIRRSWMWPYLRQAWPYGVLALTLSFAGYEGEVMRGAFAGVPKGQLEAARAFGMSRWKTFRRIWLPQAIYRALPTLTGETVLQLKSTPLVATISVIDIFAVSSKVRQDTYLTYEPLLLLALIYMAITGILVFAFSRIEARIPNKIG